MIVAAVVLPAAPLLLPGVTGGPVAEVEELRAACLEALSSITGPVVVVGASGSSQRDPSVGGPPARTRIAPGLASPDGPALPVDLEVGRMLLHSVGLGPDQVSFQPVSADLSPVDAADLGARLARDPRPSALVVLADGTPCRRESGSPVRFDPRAGAFDRVLLDALRAGDSAALTGLDAALAQELQVAGYLPLQVLSAAVPRPSRAEVTYADDPFGVYYVVARWMA